MSRSLLSKRLGELQRAGVVERRMAADGRTWEYHLTEAGAELRPIVEQLGEWGKRWAPSNFGREDLDPALLMWDIRRNIRLEALPGHRVVVEFVFTDLPRSAVRRSWLILDTPEVDVCYKDPGFDVDLLVTGTLRTLTAAWMGDVSLRRAMETGEIDVQGPRRLRDAFPRWLVLSLFADVQRRLPQA